MDTVVGLPFHPLIVHATVVIVPAAALVVLLAAVWTRFRQWAGWGPVAVAAAALVLVPLTTSSGESLEQKLPREALIEQHAHLGDSLPPWVIGLLVGAAGLYWTRTHPSPAGRRFPRWLTTAVLIVSVTAAAGTLVEVVLIGHSGAKAAWSSLG